MMSDLGDFLVTDTPSEVSHRAALLWQLGEIKSAAAQVEHIFVLRQMSLKVIRQGVNSELPLFLVLEKSGLAKDTEVLGHIVLGHVQSVSDFVHVALPAHKHAQDAEPAFLAKCF
jgi:BarA-like signal transduction histidine kinase